MGSCTVCGRYHEDNREPIPAPQEGDDEAAGIHRIVSTWMPPRMGRGVIVDVHGRLTQAAREAYRAGFEAGQADMAKYADEELGKLLEAEGCSCEEPDEVSDLCFAHKVQCFLTNLAERAQARKDGT